MDHRQFVIAITGASRGIGYTLATELARKGAKVIAGARDIQALQGHPLTALPLDVTDPDSVEAFARQAIGQGVNVLINNAGVGVFKPSEELTLQDYRRVMDTNVLGTLLMHAALVPHLKSLGEAWVINITSDVSARTFANGGLYTASKHAQQALTRALSKEVFRSGVKVTELRPGMVDTFFGDSEQGADYKAGWLQPADLLAAVEHVLGAAPHVRIDEVLLHPTLQDVEY